MLNGGTSPIANGIDTAAEWHARYGSLGQGTWGPGNLPPPGSIISMDGGSSAGHVAIYIGNGMVIDNTMQGTPPVGVHPISDLFGRGNRTYTVPEPEDSIGGAGIDRLEELARARNIKFD